MTAKDNTRATAFAYCLIFVGLGAQTTLLGPTLSSLAKIYQEDDATDLSEALLGRGIGSVIGTIVTGKALDGTARRSHFVILLSSILSSAFCALTPLAGLLLSSGVVGGRWLLFFMLLCHGIFDSSVDLGVNVLLTRLFSKEDELSPWMNLLHFSWGVGGTIGPIVAVALGIAPEKLPFTYAIVAAILPCIAVLPMLRYKSPAIEQPMHDDSSKLRNSTEPKWSVFCFLIVPMFFFYFAYAGVEHTLGDWIAAFAMEAPVHLSAEASAAATSVFWGCLTAGRLFSSWLFSLGPRFANAFFTLIVDSAAGIVALLLLGIIGVDNSTVLFVSVGACGFALASMYPMAIAFAQSRLNDDSTGFYTSLYISGAPFGGIVWPWTAGAIMRTLSAQAMPYIGTGLLTACFLTIIFIRRAHASEIEKRSDLDVSPHRSEAKFLPEQQQIF